MVSQLTSLYENKPLRTIVGTIGVITALVIFTEMTFQGIAPLAFIFMAVSAGSRRRGVRSPEGANWLVYGASVSIVGAYWVLSYPAPWVGGLLALAGLWFVFDGATTIRYGASRTTHEYVSDLEDGEMGETMLRMQTLNVVYQTLNDAPEPQTAPELATNVDLTESRVESALGFLESKGRVERGETSIVQSHPGGGRITPIVDLLVWLPRRIMRPFRLVVTDA